MATGASDFSVNRNGKTAAVNKNEEDDQCDYNDDDDDERQKQARQALDSSIGDTTFDPYEDDFDKYTTATTATTRVVYHQKPLIVLSKKAIWILTLLNFAMAAATISVWCTIFVISNNLYLEHEWKTLIKGSVCAVVFFLAALSGFFFSRKMDITRAKIFLGFCVASALVSVVLFVLSCASASVSVNCLVLYSTPLVDIYRCQCRYYIKMLNVIYILISLVEFFSSLYPLVVGKRRAHKRGTRTMVAYEEVEVPPDYME